jgi:predicted HTH transcriptional regulator
MSEKEFIHERTIQRELAILKDLGVVSRIGGRNNGYWEINKELLPSLYRVR